MLALSFTPSPINVLNDLHSGVALFRINRNEFRFDYVSIMSTLSPSVSLDLLEATFPNDASTVAMRHYELYSQLITPKQDFAINYYLISTGTLFSDISCDELAPLELRAQSCDENEAASSSSYIEVKQEADVIVAQNVVEPAAPATDKVSLLQKLFGLSFIIEVTDFFSSSQNSC